MADKPKKKRNVSFVMPHAEHERNKKTGLSRDENCKKVGILNKTPRITKTMKDTIEDVWLSLQVCTDENCNPTDLYSIASENPKWFYELCKPMFPKELFINHDLNLNNMSPEEIRAEIVKLIASEPQLIEDVQILTASQET